MEKIYLGGLSKMANCQILAYLSVAILDYFLYDLAFKYRYI